MTDSEEDKIDKFFDLRLMRPSVVKEKSTKLSYHLQIGESFEVNGKKIFFLKPNIIGIFVSIADKEFKKAKEIFIELIDRKLSEESPIEFKGAENSMLYDYFERIQISIISIYTAVEALSNVAIPENFTLEKTNNKGIKEIWNKESIERWMSTSDKLADIVPKILKVPSPKKLQIWTQFKKLEEIRNEIIHQKTTAKNENIDTNFLRKLLLKNIFKIVESGFRLIYFFCSKDKSHPFFPYGFTEIKIKPLEVENMGDLFKHIEDDPSNKK